MNPSIDFTRCLGTAIAFGLLATARAQEPPHGAPPEKMQVERTDGRSFEAQFLHFDFAEGVAVFVRRDGGEGRILCSAMKADTVAKIAMKMPPVVGWLDPKKSYLCIRVVAAVSPEAEIEAAEAIRQAAEAAPAEKEKLALFQLYGVVSLLVKADEKKDKATAHKEMVNKSCDKADIATRAWAARYGTSPLTGSDERGRRHLERYLGETASARNGALLGENMARRELMLRLASARIYLGYCEISNRGGYAKELGELRQKILVRSATARELEGPGASLLAWLASRVSVHHHTGNNAKLLKEAFAKMVADSQTHAALRLILPKRPPQDCFAVKAALLALTEPRLTQDQFGDGVAQEALWQALKKGIADYEPRKVIEKKMLPFLEEAVRMGTR
jgi:hypothetical protein